MDAYDWIASDEVLWGLLGLAALAFIWNGARRITWENATKDSRVRIPESVRYYGASELKEFSRILRHVQIEGQPALGYYAGKILRGSDIAYAIALATITAYVWFRLAIAYAPSAPESWLSSAVVWFAPYCGAMAIAYGVADVAEDLKLASILWPKAQDDDEDRYPAEIDRAEAAAANMLTVIKMLTLLLSIIGFVLFLLLRLLQSIAKGLSGMLVVAADELFRRLREARAAGAGSPAVDSQ
jgi:hypothetical protein